MPYSISGKPELPYEEKKRVDKAGKPVNKPVVEDTEPVIEEPEIASESVLEASEEK